MGARWVWDATTNSRLGSTWAKLANLGAEPRTDVQQVERHEGQVVARRVDQTQHVQFEWFRYDPRPDSWVLPRTKLHRHGRTDVRRPTHHPKVSDSGHLNLGYQQCRTIGWRTSTCVQSNPTVTRQGAHPRVNALARRRRPLARLGNRIPTAVRSILHLMVGTVGAQAVNILAVPLLARLFGPYSLGVYAYIISIVLIASSVAALRMEWAIPLPTDERDARSVTQVALLLVAVLSSLGALFLLIFRDQLQNISSSSIISVYLLDSPTSGIDLLVQRPDAGLLTRSPIYAGRPNYSSSEYRFHQRSVLSSALTRTPNGLLAGHAAGRISGLASLARTNRHLLLPRERKMSRALKTYWRFPVVFAPSSLLNTLGSNLPLIILGSTFGASAAGNFSMAQRIALIPSTIVGTAVGQVFLSEIVKLGKDSTTIGPSISERPSGSCSFAVPIIIGLAALLSRWLFVVVLGDQWIQAGEFAQLISVSVGIGFIASPLSFVFVAYQRTLGSRFWWTSRVLFWSCAPASPQHGPAMVRRSSWGLCTPGR